MKSTPIALFCHKRLDTLKKCINALVKCPESCISELIIFSDAAASEKVANKVIAVREYIATITGFNSIKIISREMNLGVDYNLIDGLTYMKNEYDQFIVVEDDLIVEPNFITYLNEALEFYRENKNIHTISAFNWIENIPHDYPYDIYFTKRFWPWGWATWSDRMENIDWEIEDKKEFLNSKRTQTEFNKWGSDRSMMLTNVIKGEIRTWDIQLDYHFFKENASHVFPVKSLVDNIGYNPKDASHTFVYSRYKTSKRLMKINQFNFPSILEYNFEICKLFVQKNSIKARMVSRIFRYLGIRNS